MEDGKLPIGRARPTRPLHRPVAGHFTAPDRALETTETIDPRLLRRDAKRRMIGMLQREHLRDVMTAPPEKGYSYHLVSNGKFDFWTWVPVMLNWIGAADEFYCSTWTLNRRACVELFELIDAGRIKKAAFLTGLYFKRRETAVYATLLEGLLARGHRYIALANHAKLLLLRNRRRRLHIVVEGSANLTANPRIEQYVISNDPKLFNFHQEWMEQVLGEA